MCFHGHAHALIKGSYHDVEKHYRPSGPLMAMGSWSTPTQTIKSKFCFYSVGIEIIPCV